MATIKVGFLISYDYDFIKISLPRVYAYASEIYFAIDADGKTWSGSDYTIPDEFWEWVSDFDKEQKIHIYRDQFFVEGLTPMQCDTRERNMLGKAMGVSDWYVQIDSDEYFYDFKAFASKLLNFNAKAATTVNCRVVTLFKKVAVGYLLIDDSFETLSFATNNPVYDVARNNESGNEIVNWEDIVLHQSWARDSMEIKFKLDNWSHKNDFSTNSFFNLWSAIDEFNYTCLHNFHPLTPTTWPRLRLLAGDLLQLLDEDRIGELSGKGIAPVKKKPLLSRLWKEIKG
jgi:hypothetical protein